MLRILEIAWLTIVLIGSGIGAFKWLTEGFSSAWWYFLFAGVASIFWSVRRSQRRRITRRGASR